MFKIQESLIFVHYKVLQVKRDTLDTQFSILISLLLLRKTCWDLQLLEPWSKLIENCLLHDLQEYMEKSILDHWAEEETTVQIFLGKPVIIKMKERCGGQFLSPCHKLESPGRRGPQLRYCLCWVACKQVMIGVGLCIPMRVVSPLGRQCYITFKKKKKT